LIAVIKRVLNIAIVFNMVEASTYYSARRG